MPCFFVKPFYHLDKFGAVVLGDTMLRNLAVNPNKILVDLLDFAVNSVSSKL